MRHAHTSDACTFPDYKVWWGRRVTSPRLVVGDGCGFDLCAFVCLIFLQQVLRELHIEA